MATDGSDASPDFARTYWQNAVTADGRLAPLDPQAVDDATFRLLADSLPTLCWIANGDGYIVWYNRRWYDYTGTTPAQIEGWGWTDVHDPERLPDVMARWQAAIVAGEPFEMTFPLRGADGVFRPFLTRIVPVRDASGAVARWCGVNTKISHQVAAEQALQAERDRARAVLDGMGEGFIVLDQRFCIEEINAEGLRIGDRAREEAVGRPLLDVWPELAELPSWALYQEAMATGEPRLIEYQHPSGDDGLWLEVRAYPIGKRLAIFFRDVSARRHAEDALREREERLRLVIEGATDHAILTIDPDLRITSWSVGAAAAFGWDVQEIIGQAVDVLFTPEDRASGQPEHETATALREGVAPDVRWHQRKDGSRVFLNGVMRPLRDAQGRHVGFHKIARDETERQRRDDALRETEERYRLAARATNDAVWDWRMADGQVVWNDAVETLFGHAERETHADWWIEHIHPEDRDRVAHGIHGAIDGDGAQWSDEYRFRRADGSHAHVLDRGTVLRDEDGRAVRMIGAILDLTERRRMEERLRASDARYRTLFDSIDEGFCVIEVLNDDDGRPHDYRFVEVNRAFEAQTGLSDAQGRTMREFAPAMEQYWFDTYGGVARTRDPVRFTNHARELGRWYDVYAFPFGSDGSQLVAVLFSDITPRVEAERALQGLNETLEHRIAEAVAERDRMWRLSSDLMLVARFDATITAVNPAWTKLFGWTTDELIGRPFLDLVHPDDVAATAAAAGNLADGERVTHFRNRYRGKDGDYCWLSWTAVPEAGFIHAVGRDVTAEVAAAAELEHTQEQLRQAQKMEAVGQLTGGIAHDFNNLLTGVIGSLDMLQRRMARGETDKVDRYITTAITSANRAAALTHRLLAFSRRQPLDPRPVNANKLITGMEELLRRTIGEQVRLEIVTAGGLWQTLCDPNQLESAVLNLAINARDAMADGGQLTIETCNAHLDNAYVAQQREVSAGQYVCICVTDTGTGMSADVIAKAFDPFFTTKPIGQGTGLGLSMIYGFARQSEGYAKLYSEEGQGTTVKLYLPRYYGEADDAEDAAAQLTEAHRAHAGEVVLVVEDETAVRELVVDVLQELGYNAVQAVDGPSGLKLLETGMRLDLLVTDVGLPGLNGRQLADAARTLRPKLKVLFMTGYAENATIANGFLEPGMEMITKPFAIEALATRIRDMIEDG